MAANPTQWLRAGADAESPVWSGPLDCHRLTVDDVDWSYGYAGAGPTIVLLHGTGSALHTWRDLGPLLARHFTVLAIDLPGHGDSQTSAADAMTLPGMARRIGALLGRLGAEPQCIVGHSAGAALATQLVLSESQRPVALVALAGAFLPYGGPLQSVLAPLAGLLAGSDWVARRVAARARDLDGVDRLIRSTGSRISAAGLAAYQATLQSPPRVRATLTMMARWDIEPLFRSLGTLTVPLHLIVGRRDAAVTPWQADRVLRRCPVAFKTELPNVGHLLHEEAPELVAPLIVADARRGEVGSKAH